MTEPKTKAKPARPFEGKPAWHGLYWQNDKWNFVCNADGLPIIYITPQAANAAAWLRAE